MIISISEEVLEAVKTTMCDEYCHWPVVSTEEILEKHCEECPMNQIGNPLGYNPWQE